MSAGFFSWQHQTVFLPIFNVSLKCNNNNHDKPYLFLSEMPSTNNTHPFLMDCVQAPSFPNPAYVQDLQENVARMMAFTVLTFSVWVTSLVWYVLYGPD